MNLIIIASKSVNVEVVPGVTGANVGRAVGSGILVRCGKNSVHRGCADWPKGFDQITSYFVLTVLRSLAWPKEELA